MGRPPETRARPWACAHRFGRPSLSHRSLASWHTAALQFSTRHRRRIVAAVVTGLGGFTVTAFGIAPLMPDAADLPVHEIHERVQPDGLDAQLEALAAQNLSLTRSTVSRGTDSVDALLQRLGVSDAAAAAFMRQDALARRLLQGRGGKLVQALADGTGRLEQLVARYPTEDAARRQTHFTRLTLSRDQGRWVSRLEVAALEASVRLGSGTIRSSLFAATDEAGLPDAVAAQLAEVFAADIDFHRELRKGDTFAVVYEALSADGQAVPWNEGSGRVLAAEFVNAGRTQQAMWFVDAQGRGGYYSPEGVSRKRAFLGSPLAFSRVTSGFKMRMHPLLKTWRAHLGVDYGAPTGTAVRSVGDGVISFAGRQNGYGNVVEIRHDARHTTLYAHLSRIDVRKGERVEQGQTIGGVGATGWATGSHLHFEFRIGGRHQDPLRVARTSQAQELSAADRGRFSGQAQLALGQMALAGSLTSTRAGFE
ncbi:MAG: peptidase M23 [Rubrivivax sp. SCN 71-131]|nr:MAG: peptidase M23 [Rubrivivax sp. SCN 71-131]